MACWDCLGSAGIDPTMPGLARSLPRGVDRAPGPLFLLPGPCRLRRTCARGPLKGILAAANSHRLVTGYDETVRF